MQPAVGYINAISHLHAWGEFALRAPMCPLSTYWHVPQSRVIVHNACLLLTSLESEGYMRRLGSIWIWRSTHENAVACQLTNLQSGILCVLLFMLCFPKHAAIFPRLIDIERTPTIFSQFLHWRIVTHDNNGRSCLVLLSACAANSWGGKGQQFEQVLNNV
jgi:hypothetical protein